MKYFFWLIVTAISFLQCKDAPDYFKNDSQEGDAIVTQNKKKNVPSENDNVKGTHNKGKGAPVKGDEEDEKTMGLDWVKISEKDGFLIEIKYATKDNFTRKVIYDCEACFLRPEVAQALIEARKEILEKYGYGIKLLDCYRPGPFQQRLWDIMPDEDYVAHPEKGSMHSRGTAVDLTLVDLDGNELDMGTPFDYFGEEAQQDYKGHSDAVNRHRYILRSTMKKYGLEQIRTEWWHYSYRARSYPLEDWVWECN